MDRHKIEALSKLPNIGKVLAEKLYFAGIESPEMLAELGIEQAFIKLLAFDVGACINHLYAMDGAIKRIRWHDLSKHEKDELLLFFNSIKR